VSFAKIDGLYNWGPLRRDENAKTSRITLLVWRLAARGESPGDRVPKQWQAMTGWIPPSGDGVTRLL